MSTNRHLKTVTNKYEIFTLKTFFEEYNYTKEDYINNPIVQFRYMCYKMVPFIKTVLIPKIQKKSYYEAVFVEFRILPHIELIIRNAILKLGSKWAFTIVCGNKNVEFVTNMCKSISDNIKIIKYDVDNMTQEEYSNVLMTREFWELFNGGKILIHQEDTLMFKTNIDDFIEYDYIGAPFPSNSNDTPNRVGNGGFSLRSKQKMIEVITKCNINDLTINSSTVDYMTYRKLTIPPEDVYFSKNLQEFNIGTVANWTVASSFSSEAVFNKDSLGCHKLWTGTTEWRSHIKRAFKFKLYNPSSNLRNYLQYLNKPEILDVTDQRHNVVDIDLYFYAKVNNIEYTNNQFLFEHMHKNGLQGVLYHPKQLTNLYPNLMLYAFLDNIYVVDDSFNILTIQEFVNKYIYNSSFEYLSNLTLSEKYNNLTNDHDLLLLVFIGDLTRGVDLLNKIIEYKKIEPAFNVAFCFNQNIYKYHSSDFKTKIKEQFDFYSIYVSNEFGNDILPTLLMYNDINKTRAFKHIIKLHTSGNPTKYADDINYLLRLPINELITTCKPYNCNCIGQSYLEITADIYNADINRLHKTDLCLNYSFVPGSIFYTTNEVLNTILLVIKNVGYRSFFLNNLYDNNAINDNSSPIHFLERLFGVITLGHI
jgi:hypothetical protein